jgi:hypothetical protein
MNVSNSRHRIALIATLALPCLAWTASAARANVPFSARSTYQIVAKQGTQIESAGTGQARPGGVFSMTMSLKPHFGNGDASGVVTLDFGNGDTLTYYFEVDWVPDPGLWTGPYVITGGTGRLAGASGAGTMTAHPIEHDNGVFDLDGTISW